jgi:hypothetical protein
MLSSKNAMQGSKVISKMAIATILQNQEGAL